MRKFTKASFDQCSEIWLDCKDKRKSFRLSEHNLSYSFYSQTYQLRLSGESRNSFPPICKPLSYTYYPLPIPLLSFIVTFLIFFSHFSEKENSSTKKKINLLKCIEKRKYLLFQNKPV